MVAESTQMTEIVVQEMEEGMMETRRRGKEGGLPPLSVGGMMARSLTMLSKLFLLDVPN